MHRAKEPSERARNIAKKLAGVGKRKKSADPPHPAKRACYSLDDLLHCQTRKELAAVPLPPVAVSGRHKLLSTNEPTDDPFRVVSRPCERAVTQAIQQLIRTEGKNAVTLPPLGTFNIDGLRVLRSMAEAATTAQEVGDEMRWLDRVGASPEVKEKVTQLLHASPASGTLGYISTHAITARLLKCLCCERYLTDDALSAYLTTLQLSADGRACGVLCLEAFTFTWAGRNTDEDRNRVANAVQAALLDATGPINLVAIPVHMDNHWCMAVANRRLGQIFFANSLVDSYSPPSDLITVTKRIMAIVEVHLTDEAPPFEPVAIRELAIPQQSAQHGPASCGVGAAMAVRSIVAEGGHLPPNCSWSFRESGSLRLQMLVAIAKNMI